MYDLDREMSRLRGADPQRVSQLQGELDDLRDDVVYLRVKLRRERTLPRADYVEVRDKLNNLRGRVRDMAGNTVDTSGQTASGSRSSSQGDSTYEPRSSTADRDADAGAAARRAGRA